MALEEANTIYLPFVGEYEVDSAVGVALLVVGLMVGATIWNMTDSIGEHLSSKINSAIGGLIGTNPATGEDAGGPGGV